MKPTIRQIEMIEDLPLGASDRWYVLLALTGQKKASWLQLMSDVWREGEEPVRIADEQIERLKTALRQLGIAYKLRFRDSEAGLFQPDEPSDFRKRYNQICDVFIGTSDEVVAELFEAVEVMDHKRIGRSLGYPETAVDVFGTDDSTLVDELPEHEAVECEPYVWFRLSRENFNEELSVVQGWYDVVKEHSKILTIELRKES